MATNRVEAKNEYSLPVTPAGDGRVVFMAFTTRFLSRALAKATGNVGKKEWENSFVLDAAQKPVGDLVQKVLDTQPKVLGFNSSDPVRNLEGALGATGAMLTALNCITAIAQASFDVPSKQALKKEAKVNAWEKIAAAPDTKGETFRGKYYLELVAIKKGSLPNNEYEHWREQIKQKVEGVSEQRTNLRQRLDALKGGVN